jgi:hypothetical protein
VVHVGVDIPAGGTVYATVWIETSDVAAGRTPAAPRLASAHPNPFNPATGIRFDLPRPAHVRLAVYDLRGRELVRLVDGPLDAGDHVVRWDGRDRAGAILPAGVYVARLGAEGTSDALKLTLTK